jgi:hypothetical protein
MNRGPSDHVPHLLLIVGPMLLILVPSGVNCEVAAPVLLKNARPNPGLPGSKSPGAAVSIDRRVITALS